MTQRHAQPADDASVLGEDEADFAEEASFADGAAALLPVNRDREHHATRPIQPNLQRNIAPGLLLGGRGGGRGVVIPPGRGVDHLDRRDDQPFLGARRVVRQPE